jgi:hypothetical protein
LIESGRNQIPPAVYWVWLDYFSKEISEKLAQTSQFVATPPRRRPPFRRFLSRNMINIENMNLAHTADG